MGCTPSATPADAVEGTPYTRLGVAREERRYGLGWRLSRPGEAFALDLEASRRERATVRPEHGVGFELRLRW